MRTALVRSGGASLAMLGLFAALSGCGRESSARRDLNVAEQEKQVVPTDRATVVVIFRDGRRVHTDGYEVDGDQLQILGLDGSATTVPVTEVDLPGSEEATRAHLVELNRQRDERRFAELAARLDLLRDGRKPDSTLLFFTASWCRFCDRLEDELATRTSLHSGLSRYDLREIDVDATPDVAERYDVELLPALIVVDADGDEVRRHDGFLEGEDLRAWLMSP